MEQVGGDFYSVNFRMQPIDLIMMCGWDFIQGSIAKYVLRYKYTFGIEDIKKAISYCWDENRVRHEQSHHNAISTFCRINRIDAETHEILTMIDRREYLRLDIKLPEILEGLKKNE